MKRKVFRVVAVRGINVIWASGRLFTSEERAISYIEQLASDDIKLYGHSTREFDHHPLGCCCMDEATRHTWLTVHLMTSVQDDRDYSSISYGVVAYELD